LKLGENKLLPVASCFLYVRVMFLFPPSSAPPFFILNIYSDWPWPFNTGDFSRPFIRSPVPVPFFSPLTPVPNRSMKILLQGPLTTYSPGCDLSLLNLLFPLLENPLSPVTNACPVFSRCRCPPFVLSFSQLIYSWVKSPNSQTHPPQHHFLPPPL